MSAGYEDLNDAERLTQDSTFRLIGSERTWDRGAALTSRLQTFETEMLAEGENFASLAGINRELIAKVEALDSPQRVMLDMDSTEIPVYGQQEREAARRFLDRLHQAGQQARARMGNTTADPKADDEGKADLWNNCSPFRSGVA